MFTADFVEAARNAAAKPRTDSVHRVILNGKNPNFALADDNVTSVTSVR